MYFVKMEFLGTSRPMDVKFYQDQDLVINDMVIVSNFYGYFKGSKNFFFSTVLMVQTGPRKQNVLIIDVTGTAEFGRFHGKGMQVCIVLNFVLKTDQESFFPAKNRLKKILYTEFFSKNRSRVIFSCQKIMFCVACWYCLLPIW